MLFSQCWQNFPYVQQYTIGGKLFFCCADGSIYICQALPGADVGIFRIGSRNKLRHNTHLTWCCYMNFV